LISCSETNETLSRSTRRAESFSDEQPTRS